MSTSQAEWKIPPRIKVLEALGAVADGRVHVVSSEEGRVVSSTGERTYTVRFKKEENAIRSDDNGSVYRGYLGYPAIAFLMKIGELPYDERLANALRGIPWKRLNEQYKRYSLVMEDVFKRAQQHGVSREELEAFIEKTIDILKRRRYKKLETIQKTLFG